MREIQLTQGKVALVDDDDYYRVTQYTWCAAWHSIGFYAERMEDFKTIGMSRYVMGMPTEYWVDHKNGNTLDNQKHNLRLCTRSQNLQNQKKTHGTSRYKGVAWYKRGNKWRTQIKKDGYVFHVGYFVDEADAARAYDDMARTLFESFAHTNFPQEGDSNYNA